MLRIGLTGGIGSGKTVVSDRFRQLGAAVIDTDEIAHQLTTPGAPAVQEIAREFDPGIVQNGVLDRNVLRERVFNDSAARKKLEAILHPRIREEVNHKLKALAVPYCVIVVPLLIETGFQDLVDRVLVIQAPTEKRLDWLAQRNGFSRTHVEKILSAQASDQERAAIADDLLCNDGTIDVLLRQVDELHRRYMELDRTPT